MKSKSRNGRRIGFEQLENRQMMAGIVNVELNGRDLKITGDAAANCVAIEQTSATNFRITGLAAGDNTSSTIKGPNNFKFSDIRNISIITEGGNDVVRVLGTSGALGFFVEGNLTIFGRGGGDVVYVDKAYVRGNLWIDTDNTQAEAGSDAVAIYDTFINGVTDIVTDWYSDDIHLERVTTNNNINIDTADKGRSSAADTVYLEDVWCSYRTYQYQQGQISITTGGGADNVSLIGSIPRGRMRADFVQVNTLAGKDTVRVVNLGIDNGGTIRGGAGTLDDLYNVGNFGDGAAAVKYLEFET